MEKDIEKVIADVVTDGKMNLNYGEVKENLIEQSKKTLKLAEELEANEKMK